jgi:hypothetical protein
MGRARNSLHRLRLALNEIRVRKHRQLFAFFAPTVCAAVVLATFVWLRGAIEHEFRLVRIIATPATLPIGAPASAALGPTTQMSLERAAQEVVPRYLWGTSYLFLVLSIVAGMIVCVCAVAQFAADGRNRYGRGVMAAQIVLLVTVGAVILPTMRNFGSPISDWFLGTIERETSVGILAVTRITNYATPISIALFLLAFSATLWPLSDDGTVSEEYLALQLLWQRSLLYMSAIVLMAATLQIWALHRWAAAWNAPDQMHIERIANALSGTFGAAFSMLLASMYLPGQFVLRRHVARLVHQRLPGKTTVERDEWLRTWGLGGAWKEELMWMGAIVGPLLAGGPVAAALGFVTKS